MEYSNILTCNLTISSLLFDNSVRIRILFIKNSFYLIYAEICKYELRNLFNLKISENCLKIQSNLYKLGITKQSGVGGKLTPSSLGLQIV